MDNKINWNQEEFIIFILIHASYADMDYSDPEKDSIKSKYEEDTYNKVLEIYHTMGEYEKIQTIVEYKGIYYPTAAQKQELLSMINEQFKLDGEFSRLEKTLMIFLEKLL